jgi:hypothetical protein
VEPQEGFLPSPQDQMASSLQLFFTRFLAPMKVL